MSQKNEPGESMTNMEQLEEDAAACGPACSCNTRTSGRGRWVLGALILVAAAVLVARAAMKGDGALAASSETNFALSQNAEAASVAAPAALENSPNASMPAAVADPEKEKAEGPVVCGESIQSLGDLNEKAIDKDGVFVFLAGQNASKNREVVSVIEKGVATLRGRNINMGVFTFEEGSSEYANLAKQVAPPCVLAMAKGRGASAVSDDITESKLMQAFVAASSAGGGCCPTPSGAAPANCN
ncbi:MAG: hypothetical protein GWP08_19675 [Nitrospiraceae bacterium]|nr:hypothetical protein [Nitrospiraceae bacterium]